MYLLKVKKHTSKIFGSNSSSPLQSDLLGVPGHIVDVQHSSQKMIPMLGCTMSINYLLTISSVACLSIYSQLSPFFRTEITGHFPARTSISHCILCNRMICCGTKSALQKLCCSQRGSKLSFIRQR